MLLSVASFAYDPFVVFYIFGYSRLGSTPGLGGLKDKPAGFLDVLSAELKAEDFPADMEASE